jgi:glycosyltransferase involved in cell wall biosynthesis
MSPLISVVIPTYNQGSFIGDTIRSVLNQSVRDFEIVVVDNYSTDDTESVVRGFDDPRLRYIRYDNGGVIAAGRNRGVSQSRGKLIAFLDSDDAWEENKLEIQLPHLDDEEISCVATDFQPVGDIAHTKRHLCFRPGETHRDYGYQEMILGNPVMTSSVLLRKTDFLEVGGFDENGEFSFIEDWELWLRLARKGSIRVLAQRLINYRVARKSNRDMRAVTLNYLRIFQKHHDLGFLTDSDFRRACGNAYVSIGKAFLDKNDRRALYYYWEGLRHSVGVQNKVRALGGVSLSCLPKFLRKPLLESHYLLFRP